jgi:NAD(P)-dependent dehydrogenase (short-subunit alcohol dehydrogenase family)
VARLGRLDILVNNAGVTKRRPLTELELEEWEWIQGTNLRGPFLCCKYALRQMLAQGEGGAIVNIASYLGLFAHGFAPAYTASKAGLIGLTKSLAVRYGPEQIRVNAICPAFVKTSLNAYLIDDAPDPAAEERAIAAAYPLRRLGQADDVAYAALFLASDAANWITGITLMLDGGLTAQ